MGVFYDITNAYDFLNNRFRFFLNEKHRSFIKSLFPKRNVRNCRERAIHEIFGNQLATFKISSYIYKKLDSSIHFCQPIQGNIYDQVLPIRIDLDVDRIFLQLMAFQKWISNQTDTAVFQDYTDIDVVLNEEFRALVRKVSTNSCRIYIYDNSGEQFYETIYLSDNIIDFEGCSNREKHFCSSYRIYGKMIRDS
jgi:beta-galactosidase beta subunit